MTNQQTEPMQTNVCEDMSERTGLNGWLLLFQMRIAWLACALSLQCRGAVTVWHVVVTALLAACVILFYKKKMLFRYVFMVAVAAEIVMAITCNSLLLPEHGLPILFDIGLIAALFISRRVKNTFKNTHDNMGSIADGAVSK